MINRDDLLQYLKKLDRNLNQKMTIVAVGGTGLVLNGLKDATKDVDFCVETLKDKQAIRSADAKTKSGFKVDVFHSGYIFSLQLPDDYVRRARSYKGKFQRLQLKLLSPIDIVITKTARLNERDIEDIAAIAKKKKISRSEFIRRFRKVRQSEPGSEKNLEENFTFVLKEFF